MPPRAYYQAHRVHLAERERARYRANRDVILAQIRKRYWADPEAARQRRMDHYWQQGTSQKTLELISDVPSGHELYDAATAQLHGFEQAELGSDMDSGARDLLQEFVLAALENRDATEALRAHRARHVLDRKWLVYGTALVDGLER